MPIRSSPFFVLAALVCAACSDRDPPGRDAGVDAGPCEMAVTLGVGGRGPAFEPLRDGDAGEVIVGYQGFIFIQTILKLEGVTEGQILAPFTIDLDGHEPYADNKRVDLVDGGDGAGYSAPLSLYFNDFPLPAVVGREVTLRVSVTLRGCFARYDATLTLRDDDPCIHTIDDPVRTGCYELDSGIPLSADAGAGD